MIELSVKEIESIYYENTTVKGIRLSLAAWWELHGWWLAEPRVPYDIPDYKYWASLPLDF